MLPNKEEVLSRTDSGLDIILSYYPEAAPKSGDRFPFFMLKSNKERTPSAKIYYQKSTSQYAVKCFSSGFSGDAFSLVMHEENCEFAEAMRKICARFNIASIDEVKKINKPGIEKFEAKPEQNTGIHNVETRPQFELWEYRYLFSKKVLAAAEKDWKRYNQNKDLDKLQAYKNLNHVATDAGFHSVKSYDLVTKNRDVLRFTSNENYPIFLYDAGPYKKLFKPNEPDKKYRFFIIGEKPLNFLCGFDRVERNQRAKEDEEKEINRIDGLEDDPDAAPKPIKKVKLEQVIICSGERDALNVMAIGYDAVWLNSETAELTAQHFRSLQGKASKVMNLPDIDVTGLKEAHKIALEYLDLYTIMLPSWLRNKKDWRGNPCKDVRDYLDHQTRWDFQKLVNAALPYRFWDQKSKYSQKGEYLGATYDFNNVHAYNFLHQCGFFRMPNNNNKEGYDLVNLNSHVVQVVKPSDVRQYIHQFLEERKTDDTQLRNVFYNTRKLSDNSMENLSLKDLDFADFDRDNQYFFFPNITWQVNAKEIIEHNPQKINRFVWEDELIPYPVSLEKKSPFEIFKDDEGNWDVKFNNTNCLFMCFLINTCRMHWRVELEERLQQKSADYQKEYLEKYAFSLEGELLTAEEISEQKHHFVNRVFALGYILHRYKFASKPWAIWAMENKVSVEGESQGGSGKSLCFKSLSYFMKHDFLEGRNNNLTENAYMYERITRHTDFILVDDCYEYLNFGFFYSQITGDLPVNPKNQKQYNIPFDDSPKFIFTSNYTPKSQEDSTVRRLLYTVFSDYYHDNTNNRYKETRTPRSEFGKDMFKDFTEDEWGYFINFMARCCQFYMQQTDKINPPMNEVKLRSLRVTMGEAFLEWADSYFDITNPDSEKINTKLAKKYALKDFVTDTNNKNWSTNKFTKALNAWAEYREVVLDPEELKNSTGRIIGKDSEGKATEMIYIKVNTGEESIIPNEINEDDEQPF